MLRLCEDVRATEASDLYSTHERTCPGCDEQKELLALIRLSKEREFMCSECWFEVACSNLGDAGITIGWAKSIMEALGLRAYPRALGNHANVLEKPYREGAEAGLSKIRTIDKAEEEQLAPTPPDPSA